MVPAGVGVGVDVVRAVGDGVARWVALAVALGVGECDGVRLGTGAVVLGAMLNESEGEGVEIRGGGRAAGS